MSENFLTSKFNNVIGEILSEEIKKGIDYNHIHYKLGYEHGSTGKPKDKIKQITHDVHYNVGYEDGKKNKS